MPTRRLHALLNPDHLTLWIGLSSVLCLCMVWFVLGSVPESGVPKTAPQVRFDVEVRLPQVVHKSRMELTFVPVPQSAAARDQHVNANTTSQPPMAYARYLVNWQQAVQRAADQYLQTESLPPGRVTVIVRILPNGAVDHFGFAAGSYARLEPAVYQILRMAAPYPLLPRALVHHGIGIRIERTWSFQ